MFLPLAISFGSDTFALFAGMLCGKHKLAPKVSPKKTVEGAVGGLIGGDVMRHRADADSIVLPWAVPSLIETAADLRLSREVVAVLGVIGSAISQIGDLSFSVIKREFGVKDYGTSAAGPRRHPGPVRLRHLRGPRRVADTAGAAALVLILGLFSVFWNRIDV